MMVESNSSCLKTHKRDLTFFDFGGHFGFFLNAQECEFHTHLDVVIYMLDMINQQR